MSDYLVIVESPSKAKTIEKYLGKKQSCRVYGTCSRFAKKSNGDRSKEQLHPEVYYHSWSRLKRFKISGEKSKESLSRGRSDREGKRLLGI